MGILQEARRLNNLGFNQVPTRRGKKSPALDWKPYQHKSTADRIEGWFGPGSPYTGIWTICGQASNLAVLDTDSPAAEVFWRELIGPLMDATTCVRTAKGFHYWFALAPGAVVKSWAIKDNEIAFDVKAEGGGVMTPPSPHPDGGFYEWVREPEHIQPAPTWLLDGGVAARAALAGEKPTPGRTVAAPPPPDERSLLSSLIANPPDEGGRNEWLIRVCGHYARIIPYRDVYDMLVGQANDLLSAPLDDDEVVKTADSAWKAEKAKGFATPASLSEQGIVTGEPDESNGWLIGTGYSLMCPCLVKDGDNKQAVLSNWADFDILVLGVIEGEDTTDYLIQLTTQFRTLETRLDGRILGSPRDLTTWLAERQASIISPQGDEHARTAENRRLFRYVTSQKAPAFRAVDALGWNDHVGGFLVHEGIIRAGETEIIPFGDVRPNPVLHDWAPYRYGFTGTREDAQAVLRQVLTFHDETVTSVYAAWWAACYLKVQIMQESALFPFMALEAPSESGKTTGFFALMMQLAGNYEGHGEYTMAVLRDRISSHRNSQVWIDDISDPESTWDLVRQATSEGSRTKKTADRRLQERVSLVAPIVISAEGLASLNTEKALSDRAVKLTVPSPTGRMSLHNPSRPQWDDIKDLQAQFGGDLTQIAGHLASLALEQVGRVPELRGLRVAEGRHGDKLAILRLGARVLAHMLGEDDVIGRVDAWCEQQAYTRGDNILTTEILPWLWRNYTLFATSAMNRQPVFVRDGIVWYNESLVADAWSERRGLSARQRQLGALESLRGQRRDLGIDGSGSPLWTQTNKQGRMRYHELGEEMSALVIERAGQAPDDGDEQGSLLGDPQ